MAKIEIDGKTLEAPNGKMIIEVADEAGIYIPRFCYHKKLSIAANCRMCLVEVENGRKPIPACATPIADGMKVFTKSEEALRSQKAVMEFLLINHPLDCPICDQGGECELQDLSMGFGADDSEYTEAKRSVADDDLGSLISTEMTRCIHCTRCVRFGDEVGGISELGATGRGENMQIGTYVKHAMESEVSGNIIDLCPVGALTSKPYRFSARPWELDQHDSIAPHDCLGSNVHIHTRRSELMRVVPKENEQINETWISDRDRFSYLGLKHKNRATEPLIKKDGQWLAVDWKTALEFAADGVAKVIKKHGVDEFAALASPSATLEEFYLLQKLMRGLNVENLDFRLQQTDFRDELHLPVNHKNDIEYSEIEKQSNILIIGCNIHREVPLAGLRVRKAALNQANIFSINPVDFAFHFKVADRLIVRPDQMVFELLKIVKVLAQNNKSVPVQLRDLLDKVTTDSVSENLAQALIKDEFLIITGAIFENHPDSSLLRTLVYWIKQLTAAKSLALTTGANAKGALLAGFVPFHPQNIEREPGKNAQEILKARLRGYFLLGIEPGFDCANPNSARRAMLGAEFVVSLSAFVNEDIKEYADVILPIAPFAETSGTYVNIDNIYQTVAGVKKPIGQARPAWKILRVLGNLLQVDGFEYSSSTEVLEEVKLKINMLSETKYRPYYGDLPKSVSGLIRIGEWPMYRIDSIVRHSQALQESKAQERICVRIHPETAKTLNLIEVVTVSQGDIEITLPFVLDSRVVKDAVWIPNAMRETQDLGGAFAEIKVSGR